MLPCSLVHPCAPNSPATFLISCNSTPLPFHSFCLLVWTSVYFCRKTVGSSEGRDLFTLQLLSPSVSIHKQQALHNYLLSNSDKNPRLSGRSCVTSGKKMSKFSFIALLEQVTTLRLLWPFHKFFPLSLCLINVTTVQALPCEAMATWDWRVGLWSSYTCHSSSPANTHTFAI